MEYFAPYTIVKEYNYSHSDGDIHYQWISSMDDGKIEMNVSNIKLIQSPCETLNIQVVISRAEREYKPISLDLRDMSGVNHRAKLYCYSYTMKLQFSNYLHEFTQDYNYEVICKTTSSDYERGEQLFCSSVLRLEQVVSDEQFFFLNHDLFMDEPPENWYLYILRFNDEFNAKVNSNQILKVISTFRSTNCDVVLDTKDGCLSTHRSILLQNSDVFQAMFSVEMKEMRNGTVNMTDFETKVVQKMLDFLYTRQLDELGDIAQPLYELAHRYQMNTLLVYCEEYFIFNITVDNDNIVKILRLADVYELGYLKECAFNFVYRHELELALLPSYQEYLIQTLDLDNAVATLLLADKCGIEDFKIKVFNFIKSNYLQIMKDPKFLQLFVSNGLLMQEIHVYLCK